LSGRVLKDDLSVDTIDKNLSALTLAHVFNANVDALGNYAGVDALVKDDYDSVFSHVEDASGFAVVELVRKSDLHATITHHICVVSILEVGKQPGKRSSSVASKHMANRSFVLPL
jgi:hypothetical protein